MINIVVTILATIGGIVVLVATYAFFSECYDCVRNLIDLPFHQRALLNRIELLEFQVNNKRKLVKRK